MDNAWINVYHQYIIQAQPENVLLSAGTVINCEGAPRGREMEREREREREREKERGGEGENSPGTRGRFDVTLLRLYSKSRRTASVPAAIRTPETAVSSF
jgi:hypothetical protein